MRRQKIGLTWPKVSLGVTSSIIKIVLTLILLIFTYMFNLALKRTSPYHPEEWLLWWLFAVSCALIYLGTVFAFLRTIFGYLIGMIFVSEGYLEILFMRRSEEYGKHRWFRGAEWVVRSIFKATKWMITLIVRAITQPLRTYYKPTLPAVTLSFVLVCSFFTATMWWFEAQEYTTDSATISSPVEPIIDTFMHLATNFASSGIEGGLPKTIRGQIISIVALVTFLLLFALYSNAFEEDRERKLHRLLRNRPRILPMFGHIIVTGSIPATRTLLHQLEHHGVRQDIVIATRNLKSAALAGLRCPELEPSIWAVDGELWQEDIREHAGVRYASELIVLGASLKPLDVLRTILSVEGMNPRIRTIVDAPVGQHSILDPFLDHGSCKRWDRRDLLLRWGKRRERMREDFKAIDHLAKLFHELSSFEQRASYPFHVRLNTHRFWFRLIITSIGNEKRILAWYSRLLGITPLWYTIDSQQRPDELFLIEGDSVLWKARRYAASMSKTAFRVVGIATQKLAKILRNRQERLEGDAVESALREELSDKLIEESRTVSFQTALQGFGASEAEEEREKKQGLRRCTSADRELRADRESGRLSTRAAADRELLVELAQNEIWSELNENYDRRTLIEFNNPDSVSALLEMCRRNECHERVEAYSDQELRTLWLSLCMLSDGAALSFLEALWPSNRGSRKIRFKIVRWQGSSIQYGRLLSRYIVKQGSSIVAYRADRVSEWRPCAFGDLISAHDELLVLETAFFGGGRSGQ